MAWEHEILVLIIEILYVHERCPFVREGVKIELPFN